MANKSDLMTITFTLKTADVLEALKDAGERFGYRLRDDIDIDELAKYLSDDINNGFDGDGDWFFDGLNNDMYVDEFMVRPEED